MIIRRIDIENFGPYYGQHTMRLRPPSNQNVIAIGGLNGAGKTTLLDALSFGLFGYDATFHFIKGWGRSGEDKDRRERRLASLVNRTAFREGVRSASVTLELAENDTSIEVRRQWIFGTDDRKLLREELEVCQDGLPLSAGPAVYEGYLKHRIPPNVGRFFVFDGEEIKRLAEAENLDVEVKEGIDLLLGFQVLQQLHADLEEQHSRYERATRKQSRQEAELNEAIAKAKNKELEKEDIESEILATEEKNETLREELRTLNERIKRLLGSSGKRPADLQREYDRTIAEIKELRVRVERNIESIAVSLPRSVLEKLQLQLAGEQLRREWTEGLRRVQPQRDRLLTEMFGREAPEATPPLSESQKDFLTTLLKERWEALFHPPPEGMAAQLRHEYLTSDEELPLILATCATVLTNQAEDIGILVSRIESLEREAAEMKLQIDRMKDDQEEIDELMGRRDFLNREIGENDQACNDRRRTLERLSKELHEDEREIANKRAALEVSEEFGALTSVTRRIRRTVQRFQQTLRPKKRDELREHLQDMYRRLARKEDVIQDIDLDPETYSVKLYDRRGEVLPLHALSAGEREIFALSLLWGLSQSSRNKLPVIIDTPLGRLDSKHRSNIVRKYFPSAGPQVLVLSTDTELDRRYFEMLEERVAQKFHLVFDPVTEKTTIQEGYFDLT
jgi:DNA sulfur modification protein DndD